MFLPEGRRVSFFFRNFELERGTFPLSSSSRRLARFNLPFIVVSVETTARNLTFSARLFDYRQTSTLRPIRSSIDVFISREVCLFACSLSSRYAYATVRSRKLGLSGRNPLFLEFEFGASLCCYDVQLCCSFRSSFSFTARWLYFPARNCNLTLSPKMSKPVIDEPRSRQLFSETTQSIIDLSTTVPTVNERQRWFRRFQEDHETSMTTFSSHWLKVMRD